MNSKQNKGNLRLKYKQLRKQDFKLVEKLIFNQVEVLIDTMLKKGMTGYIGIYWPLENEVNLLSLKNKPELNFALPASEKSGAVTYHQWRTNPLEKDDLGIPAPLSERPVSPSEFSLLLVPALAIDKNGFRLGYGGGYFDRLRSKPEWQSVKSLVVTPKACVAITPLPIDSWDIPFDGWVDEKGCHEIPTKPINS